MIVFITRKETIYAIYSHIPIHIFVLAYCNHVYVRQKRTALSWKLTQICPRALKKHTSAL